MVRRRLRPCLGGGFDGEDLGLREVLKRFDYKVPDERLKT